MDNDLKGADGLKGISRDENAGTKWFLSSHIRAHLYTAQKDFCGINSQALQPTMIQQLLKDETGVYAHLNTLEQGIISLFMSGTTLVNLTTRAA